VLECARSKFNVQNGAFGAVQGFAFKVQTAPVKAGKVL
jgi:hypothetical protein